MLGFAANKPTTSRGESDNKAGASSDIEYAGNLIIQRRNLLPYIFHIKIFSAMANARIIKGIDACFDANVRQN